MLRDNKIKNTKRQQIAQEIKGALSEVLKLKAQSLDIRLVDSSITVTNVEMSGDLRIAFCYFMPSFGMNKKNEKEIAAALFDNVKILRMLVSKIVKLKYSPEIRLIYDKSYDKEEEINNLLQDL